MSWSVSMFGKVSVVKARIDAEFAKNPCHIPAEEAIRQSVLPILKASLEEFSDNKAVKVEASGSFSNYGPNERNNTLNVSVQEVYGFIAE